MKNYKLKYIKKSSYEYTAILYNKYGETSVDSREYRQLKSLLSSIWGVEIPNKSELKFYGKNEVYEYFLPKNSELYMGKAEYSRSRNDMYWELHFLDMVTGEFVKLTWTGYNDDFWWNNVAPTEQARVRKGKNRKTYRIDFDTNIDNPIEAPENGMCNYAYYEYCQLRKAFRTLIAVYVDKDDMNKYIEAHELEPHLAYEIIGDKFFCEKQLRECEYYDNGCILTTCVQKEFDGINAFAEHLKSNANNLNISPEKIDEMLKIFAPVVLKNAGLREHYQRNVEEILKALQSYVDENLPAFLEFDKKVQEIRKLQHEELLKHKLGEDGYARYCEKQSKQKRRKSNDSIR